MGELRFGSLLVVITRYQVLALFAPVSANLFATVAMGNVNKVEAKHGKELFRWVQEIGRVIYWKQTVADQQEFCV